MWVSLHAVGGRPPLACPTPDSHVNMSHPATALFLERQVCLCTAAEGHITPVSQDHAYIHIYIDRIWDCVEQANTKYSMSMYNGSLCCI